MTMISTRLERLAKAVDVLVDECIGVIRHVREFPREAGAPAFFHYYAEACNTRAFGCHQNFALTGGASTDRGRAAAKAIGEAVERYCAALFDPAAFPLCSRGQAAFRCVPPDRFALYSAAQYDTEGFPYERFGDDSLIRWVESIDVSTMEAWHVPAAMVFVPYYPDRTAGECSIVQPISTGLACHGSLPEATLSAACEVIERDAVTITWQAGLAPPRIQLEDLPPMGSDLVERFGRANLGISLFDITLDHGIPTILAVAHGKSLDAPALAFAAATHLNPLEALRKSLEELAHTSRLARQLKHGPPLSPQPGFRNVLGQHDHLRLYVDERHEHLADFLFGSTQQKSFEELVDLSTGDLGADLRVLAQRLHALGHQFLCVELTTPDVKEVGLHVVRAIIPGFHPLFMGHERRALGGRRLWIVPQRLGYRGIRELTGDNPAPHPYP